MFSTRKFNIDLASSSMTTSFPIRTKLGKIPLSYTLNGNYAITTGLITGLSSLLPPSGTLTPQLNSHTFGYTVGYTTTTTLTCLGSNIEAYGGWMVYDTTGAGHSLGTFWADPEGTCYQFPSVTNTIDGSGLTVITSSKNYQGPKTIYDSSGYAYSAPTLTDPDGATITETGTFNVTTSFIDSLGATFLTQNYSSNYLPSTAVYTDASGNDVSPPYTIAYQSFKLQSNFNCKNLGYTYADYSDSAVTLPVSVTDPTGAVTKFAYESTPGYSGYTTGRLASITYGSGGSISYAYSQNGDSQGQYGLDCVSFVAPMITVTVNDNNSHTSKWIYTNYNRSSSSGSFTVTETDTAGNQTAYAFYNEFATQVATYQGGCPTSVKGCNGGGTLLRSVTTCYNTNFSNCASPASVTLPIYQTDVYTSLNGSSSNLVETKLDLTYGNVLEVKQYDFGAAMPPSGQTPLSDTITSYGQSWNSASGTCNAYTSGYIYNTPCHSYTKNSAGTTVAQTQITYNSAGHPTTTQKWTSGSNWLTTTLAYGTNGAAAGVLSAVTDSNGSTTNYVNFQCSGILPGGTKLPQISGESFQMSSSQVWDCNGGVITSSTDLNTPANTTTYGYNDPLWRQTEVSYPDGGSTTTTYNSPTSISTSSLISGATYLTNVATYDGLGRELQTALTSDPGGTSYRAITYNAIGEIYQVYNPTRCNPPTTNCGQEGTWGATTYSYDALGRMTQLTHPDNSYISAVYTGRATEVTDEGNGSFNVQRISQVDGLGRLTSVCEVTQTNPGGGSSCGQDIGATGFLTSYTYDALGNLLTVAQGSLNGRTYQYDGLSRLTSASDPESGTIYYGYNSSGDLYQRISPTSNDTGTIGTTTTYTYDLLHRPTNITYKHSDGSPASLPVAYYYDEPNPWGVTATNYKGRLSQTAAQNFTVGSVYSYDSMGRVINEWQCTPMDCGTTATYFTYGYDKLGNLTSSNNNSDGITYTYGPYNGADELTQMQSSLNDSQHPGTLVQFNTYSAFGRPEQIVYGNGVTTSLGYDTRMRLYFSNQGTPYDYNIMKSSSPFVTGYAPDNDILYGNDSVNGDWTYTYDALNRLVTASCNTTYSCPPTSGVTYTYDRYGNRLAESVTSGSGAQPAYEFNAHNQIDVSGVTYDEAGNVIASGTGIGDPFSYDDENRVTGAGFYSASYVYDAFGNRVRSTVNGQTNDFLYDLSGRTVDQFGNGTLSRSEAYAGGMHIATYENGTTYFDSSDWLSTFRVRTDISGTNVESCTSLPFGEDLTCTLPLTSEVSPLHFTGQEHDWESGNDHFAFRYYNEVMARWLTPDPAGLAAADPTNPQTWNRYAYVANNPLSLIDPSGLNPGGLSGNGCGGYPCQVSFGAWGPSCFSMSCGGPCAASIDQGVDAPCSLAFGSALGTLSGNFNMSSSLTVGSEVDSTFGTYTPPSLVDPPALYDENGDEVPDPLYTIFETTGGWSFTTVATFIPGGGGAANNFPTSNNPTITAVHPPRAKPSSWWSKYTTQLSCEASVAIADISDQQDLFEGSGVVLGAGLAANSLTLGLAGDALIGAGLIGDAFHARSICVPLAWGN